MVNKKTTLLMAGILIGGAAFYVSASTVFMALLMGLLFIPPVLMISAALIQGVLILSDSLYNPEKEDIVISV